MTYKNKTTKIINWNASIYHSQTEEQNDPPEFHGSSCQHTDTHSLWSFGFSAAVSQRNAAALFLSWRTCKVHMFQSALWLRWKGITEPTNELLIEYSWLAYQSPICTNKHINIYTPVWPDWHPDLRDRFNQRDQQGTTAWCHILSLLFYVYVYRYNLNIMRLSIRICLTCRTEPVESLTEWPELSKCHDYI